MGIRRNDYYFKCYGCGQKYHIRKRRYISRYYCPICDNCTAKIYLKKNPTKKEVIKQRKFIEDLRKSNLKIMEESRKLKIR